MLSPRAQEQTAADVCDILLLSNETHRISEFYDALVLFVFRVLVGKRFNVAEIDFNLL